MNKQGRAAAPRLGCRPALPVGCTLGVICCWNSRFSSRTSPGGPTDKVGVLTPPWRLTQKLRPGVG